MKSNSAHFLFACLALLAFCSCKKEEDKKPEPIPIQDTVGANQFVICKIDTIPFISSEKSDRIDTIKVLTTNTTFTDFYASNKVLRNGQQLIRSVTLRLFEFESMKVASYVDGRIYAKSRTDVLANGGGAVDNLYWAKYVSSQNNITVTSMNDSLVRGTFRFSLQTEPGGAQKIEVTNGVFKIRTK